MKQAPTNCPTPVVDVMYRDIADRICHKYIHWHHEPTDELLKDWVLDYIDKITDGYLPEGFTKAPVPFCVRIYKRGNLLAEWMPKRRHQIPSPTPCTESLVTAQPNVGRGGIPAAVLSTTASGVSSFRSSSAHSVSESRKADAYPDLTAVNYAGEDERLRSGSGQSVA